MLAMAGVWTPYIVPRGSTWLFATVLSGGGGGGGGASRTAGVNGRGGGGGSPSIVFNAMFSAFLLPECIYVYVGNGGVGGAADNNGGNGESTVLSIAPNANAGNVILLPDSGKGGSAGGIAAGGAGGVGASVNIFHTHTMCAVANSIAIVGAAGGTTGNGVSTGAQARSMCLGGSGGGAVSTGNAAGNGGQVNAITPFIPAVGVTPGDGADGTEYDTNLFWFCSAGQGGAGNAAGTGYRGGRGAYGSGGGGGGAGTPTGGRGGDGGQGIVILYAI